MPSSRPDELKALYSALEAVAPELEATAREAEELRRAPDSLAAAMRAARIPMSKVPRELGGFELTPAEQIDYFARVAYLNPTAGWLAFNQAGSLGLIGAKLCDEGIKTIFAGDCPLVAAVSAPTGQSTKVDGGYRVTGRWSYASGVGPSDWTLLSSICSDPVGVIAVIVPSGELTLHDDWHVAALKGSGSLDVSLEDHFVPESMTVNPFGAQLRGGPLFGALPYKVYVAGENFGFSLGVAQRLVDEVAAVARHKRRFLDSNTVGDRGAFQIELGRCDLTLRSARALMQSELELVQETVDGCEGSLPEAARLRAEGALAHASEMLIQSATRLFPFAGASALHLSSPIQRALRDLIGSGQHLVASNQQIEFWGKAILDDPADPSEPATGAR